MFIETFVEVVESLLIEAVANAGGGVTELPDKVTFVINEEEGDSPTLLLINPPIPPAEELSEEDSPPVAEVVGGVEGVMLPTDGFEAGVASVIPPGTVSPDSGEGASPPLAAGF